MLIAVASKSGTEVDQHFGHAERFLIYDCRQGRPQLLREVTVEKYCSYDPDHPFRHAQFNTISDALQGCRAVLTVMIGELPKQELKKIGIEALIGEGSIEAALLAAHDALCDCGRRCGQRKCSPQPS